LYKRWIFEHAASIPNEFSASGLQTFNQPTSVTNYLDVDSTWGLWEMHCVVSLW